MRSTIGTMVRHTERGPIVIYFMTNVSPSLSTESPARHSNRKNCLCSTILIIRFDMLAHIVSRLDWEKDASLLLSRRLS